MGVSKTLKWYAPNGQKLLAQGSVLGVIHSKAKRPVRAKALIINAFALTGRIPFIYPYTQGGALGYVLIGLSARFFCLLGFAFPLRAGDLWFSLLFCLLGLAHFRAGCLNF